MTCSVRIYPCDEAPSSHKNILMEEYLKKENFTIKTKTVLNSVYMFTKYGTGSGREL